MYDVLDVAKYVLYYARNLCDLQIGCAEDESRFPFLHIHLPYAKLNPPFSLCLEIQKVRISLRKKSRSSRALLYVPNHTVPLIFRTFLTFSVVWDSQETQLFPPNWHRSLPARFRALASPFAVPKSSFAIPHFPPIIACSFSAPKRRKRGDRIASMCTHTTDTSSAYNPLRNRGFWMIFTLDSTPACRRSCPPQ